MRKLYQAVPLALMLAAGLTLAACGGGGGDDGGDDGGGGGGDAGNGEELFAATCASCHGEDATGLEGLGKDLTNSAFADGLGDAELAAFIVAGRTADDPANTTGVAMPPKGGNPSLTDDEIDDLVAYLRTL